MSPSIETNPIEAAKILKNLNANRRLIAEIKGEGVAGWQGGEENSAAIYQTPEGDILALVDITPVDQSAARTRFIYPTRLKKNISQLIKEAISVKS